MTTRRAIIAAGAGATVLAGLAYRAWDRGVFSAGEGAAFAPWAEWRGADGEGEVRPLHAAILAANPHDTQPWLFSVAREVVTVWADRARNLGSFDPFRREMYLGLGCAIANLQAAASEFGYSSKPTFASGRLTLSQPDTPVEAARVALVRGDAPEADLAFGASLRDLAQAIPRRHTNRTAFKRDKPLPATLVAEWSKVRPEAAVRVAFVTDAPPRLAMSRLIVEATKRIIADGEMSADSARWFRTGRREIEAHRDGVTIDAAGLSPLLRAAAKMLPDVSAETADKDWLAMTRDSQLPTAPALGVILVRDRLDIAQALDAGRAWQFLHLAATIQGIAAQPLNQPVEMIDRNAQLGRSDEFAPALAEIAGVTGWEPTFAFRMGYAEGEAPLSPRRPLSEVLRNN
jgi:nitroreductase